MQQSPFYQEWQQEAELRGEQRGRELGRQEVAIRLLQAGIPLETISQATKLSIAQIKELQAQLSQ